MEDPSVEFRNQHFRIFQVGEVGEKGVMDPSKGPK